MLILVGWKFWDSPPQFVVKSSWGEWAAGNCNCFLFIQFEFKVNYVALIQILTAKREATKANEIGGHYLVDMVCLLVSRKQKEKLSEGWFRVVTFQQLCKHSGIYDSRFREGNRNLSPTCDKNCQNSKIVFLKHRFKQFPKSY